MNIGSLYKVKKWFWFLFPTKETAALTDATATAASSAASAVTAAAWYSERYNCEVTYFSPDSYIVFLEEDGVYKKLLTSDGLVGWTWFIESDNECFEEVKTEEKTFGILDS